MSVPQATSPTGGVQFTWIVEAWNWFRVQGATWVFATLIAGLLPFALMYAAVLALMWPSMSASIQAAQGGRVAPPPTFGSSFYVEIYAIYVVFLFVFAYFASGLLGMGIRQARGLPISVGDVFGGGRNFLRFFGFLLLVFVVNGVVGFGLSIAMLGGSLMGNPTAAQALFSTPAGIARYFGFLGVALMIEGLPYALFMAVPAMIADGRGVFESLGLSARAAFRNLGPAIGLVILFGFIWLISFLPCGLGALITTPMAVLISTFAYRDLIGMPMPPRANYGQAVEGVWPPPPSVASYPQLRPDGLPPDPVDQAGAPPSAPGQGAPPPNGPG